MHSGLLIAICILIIMLLVCHTMNFLYPRTVVPSINKFFDLPSKIQLPTQYNLISYDNQLAKIPCNNHPQIPCKVQEQCKTATQTHLSDSELALLYKQAYEMAGNEVLWRTLKEMQNPGNPSNTTIPNTTIPIS